MRRFQVVYGPQVRHILDKYDVYLHGDAEHVRIVKLLIAEGERALEERGPRNEDRPVTERSPKGPE